MRHVLFELDKRDHLSRKAFVDTAMQGISESINEAYGKVIHNQQAYIRSTEYQVLTKISRSAMSSISTPIVVIFVVTRCKLVTHTL